MTNYQLQICGANVVITVPLAHLVGVLAQERVAPEQDQDETETTTPVPVVGGVKALKDVVLDAVIALGTCSQAQISEHTWVVREASKKPLQTLVVDGEVQATVATNKRRYCVPGRVAA